MDRSASRTDFKSLSRSSAFAYRSAERFCIAFITIPSNDRGTPRFSACGEGTGSVWWRMDDRELGELVRQSLEQAGIPLRAQIRRVATRRLERAYPLYELGYEARFSMLDSWLDRFENLLTFGRQGLFAHDNTHHALFMAYSAVDTPMLNGAFGPIAFRLPGS